MGFPLDVGPCRYSHFDVHGQRGEVDNACIRNKYLDVKGCRAERASSKLPSIKIMAYTHFESGQA